MDVSPFVTRLREQLLGLPLRDIDAAAGLDAAMRGNRAAPAVYVLPLSERGEPLDHTGPTDQWEHRLVGVLMVVQTLNASGGPGVIDLAALRDRVKRALIGWVPEEATGEPVFFLGGKIAQFEGDGQMWWSDEFSFKGYFRSNP
ncbi:hypothetical protein AVMA1855_23380 [Acidovorax sp. SUPP1855]|uniref:phage tail terminator protein n=1 Tax=Acidovorax sp. SUPP1855 TaxID=431774 RepID=UPI0023DE5092|nr:hypothetical protein [Acidovorax sp. SUPP1855]GKS87150.1 hypothetical protein AVMA1855_23380 [Acidovorax sp. SUPP1855]